MKVPYSWLKEYVDLDISAQELTDKLFDCGFEVEATLKDNAFLYATAITEGAFVLILLLWGILK